jgi:SAM-dependent methyltransferase
MDIDQTACSICKGSIGSLIHATDKMHGGTERFTYGQCSGCGCLQLLRVPENYSTYYPPQYYSFKMPVKSNFKALRKNLKIKFIFNHPKIMSGAVAFLTRNYNAYWIYKNLGVSASSRILDVGTGSGEHVLELWGAGFSNALGIDWFVANDIEYSGKPLVKKTELAPELGEFDLITFHHSLEHIRDQVQTLEVARDMLSPQGHILVRIPTVSSVAYDEFKENWFQLDAPRHLFLHSHKSILITAEAAGLIIDELWCDSNEMQFIVSEQYQSGITGNNPGSYLVNKKSKVVSQKYIGAMKLKSEKANRSLRGDQVCIVMSRA